MGVQLLQYTEPLPQQVRQFPLVVNSDAHHHLSGLHTAGGNVFQGVDGDLSIVDAGSKSYGQDESQYGSYGAADLGGVEKAQKPDQQQQDHHRTDEDSSEQRCEHLTGDGDKHKRKREERE